MSVEGFSPEALETLFAAPWPGNVRQLANVVEYCVAMASAPLIPAGLVQEALRDEGDGVLSLAVARDEFDRRYLVRVLKLASGNVRRASEIAGRNRTEFYRLLKRHEIRPADFKET